MADDVNRVEAALREQYGAFKDLKVLLLVENFLQGKLYYCEFNYVERDTPAGTKNARLFCSTGGP